MGSGIFPRLLRAVRLARIWYHVPKEWRGKGLLGGCLSKTEAPRHRDIRRERYPLIFQFCKLYRESLMVISSCVAHILPGVC